MQYDLETEKKVFDFDKITSLPSIITLFCLLVVIYRTSRDIKEKLTINSCPFEGKKNWDLQKRKKDKRNEIEF